MIYYNNKSVKKLYNGTDLVEQMNKTVGGSRLPDGYTEVEYVENTSTAYIDTGLYIYDAIGNTFTVTAKMSSQPYGNDFECLLSNEQGNAAPYIGILWRWYQGNIQYGGDNTNTYTKSLTQNEDGTSSLTVSCDSIISGNTTSLTFFCGKQGNTIWRNGRGKLYSSTVVKNGVIVGEFVPCINPNNVVGVYNLANNTFYGSANNKTLIAGNPVTPAENKAIFQYVTDDAAPYDAEIEYLENDGTQFINTNIALNPSNFEVGYEIESSGFWWGFTHQGRGNGTWISLEENSGGTSNTVFFGKFDNRFTISTASENTIKFVSTSGVTVNGTNYSKTFSLGTDSISSTPLYLFTRYDFASRNVDTTQWGFKLKSFYLKNNGVLVLDMIPVRVGQVGYMYDKVSGQLFGNDGTGSFILGADK